eukprot:5362578-Pyramimonas_sp.AAC.1
MGRWVDGSMGRWVDGAHLKRVSGNHPQGNDLCVMRMAQTRGLFSVRTAVALLAPAGEVVLARVRRAEPAAARAHLADARRAPSHLRAALGAAQSP